MIDRQCEDTSILLLTARSSPVIVQSISIDGIVTVAEQREELDGEAEQRHTTTSAAHREEMVDGEGEEPLAIIEKQSSMDRKEKPQVKDISKKIKKGIREQKNKNT